MVALSAALQIMNHAWVPIDSAQQWLRTIAVLFFPPVRPLLPSLPSDCHTSLPSLTLISPSPSIILSTPISPPYFLHLHSLLHYVANPSMFIKKLIKTHSVFMHLNGTTTNHSTDSWPLIPYSLQYSGRVQNCTTFTTVCSTLEGSHFSEGLKI